MNDLRIDLHVHSTASDGTLSPKEVAALAAQQKLAAFALTDHDTIDGIAEASAEAKTQNIEFIPGVELSCSYQEKEVHMVGLSVNLKDAVFCKTLQDFRDNRENRNAKMAQKLQKEGFSVTLQDVEAAFPNSVITRAHFARYLVDTQQVKDLPRVFEKYLGDGCRCYVTREKISPFEAISLIKNAGGLPILAHPLLYHLEPKKLEQLVSDLKDCGLIGLEAIYSMNMGNDESNMKALAKHYDLCISGGSDFHGSNKPHIKLGVGRGTLFVPYSVLDALKEVRK